MYCICSNPEKAKQQAIKDMNKASGQKISKLSQQEIDYLNKHWQDSEASTLMWQLISNNDKRGLRDYLAQAPGLAHVRSSDGRGPMWWAHEYGRTEIVKFLKKLGVSDTLADADGVTPLDLSAKSEL